MKYNDFIISNSSNKNKLVWQVIKKESALIKPIQKIDISPATFNDYFANVSNDVTDILNNTSNDCISLCFDKSQQGKRKTYFKFQTISSPIVFIVKKTTKIRSC